MAPVAGIAVDAFQLPAMDKTPVLTLEASHWFEMAEGQTDHAAESRLPIPDAALRLCLSLRP